MSVRQMSKVWELDVRHPQRLLLLALADHADDGGRSVRPSIAYLAWKTGYQERQVRNIVRDLRKLGALVPVRPASQHRPVEYRLCLGVLPLKPPYSREAKIASRSVSVESGVQSTDARGAISDARPAIAIAPESSVESSDETSGRDVASPTTTPELLSDGRTNIKGNGLNRVGDAWDRLFADQPNLRAWFETGKDEAKRPARGGVTR